jgi:hypothetical protein
VPAGGNAAHGSGVDEVGFPDQRAVGEQPERPVALAGQHRVGHRGQFGGGLLALARRRARVALEAFHERDEIGGQIHRGTATGHR